MPRNFGLSPRALPRKLGSGANAGVSFFKWKAAAKCMKDRLCEAKGPAAERVSVQIEHAYRRVFFVHDVNNLTQAHSSSAQFEGTK